MASPSTSTALREGAEAIADAQPPLEDPPIAAALAAALVEALKELTVIEPDRTAKVEMKQGGSYSYKYADIGDVVKLTRPVLAKHGLIALTPIHDHGDYLACTVTIFHTSGGRLDLGPFPFPHGRDAQATGSMVTYHRRYALVAALGMATGEDDDGATAAPRQDDRSATVPAVPAQDAKKQLLGVLAKNASQPTEEEIDASAKAWEAAGHKGKRYIPQTDLDALLQSVAPFGPEPAT